jgi:hypothetical protein
MLEVGACEDEFSRLKYSPVKADYWTCHIIFSNSTPTNATTKISFKVELSPLVVYFEEGHGQSRVRRSGCSGVVGSVEDLEERASRCPEARGSVKTKRSRAIMDTNEESSKDLWGYLFLKRDDFGSTAWHRTEGGLHVQTEHMDPLIGTL